MQAWLRLTAGLLLAMTATTLALCAPPKAVIAGPTQANPGDLVILDANQSEALGFAWVLTDSDKSFLPVEDGRKVVFASGSAGRYTFVLVAATADDPKKPLIDIARHTLTIGEPPNPGPGPNPPGPNPEPLPPGRFGLAAWSRDTASTTLTALTATQRVESAKLLAGSFEGIASAIAAGTIRSLDDVNTKTQVSNRAALGAYQSSWMAWATQLNAKIAALDDAGQIKTTDDAREAWLEIATGLRAVK